VPQVVSRRQALRALHDAGLLEAVQAAVSNADEITQIEWQTAGEFARNWPTLQTLASALGMTEQQLDGLFLAASKL